MSFLLWEMLSHLDRGARQTLIGGELGEACELTAAAWSALALWKPLQGHHSERTCDRGRSATFCYVLKPKSDRVVSLLETLTAPISGTGAHQDCLF